ncbi:MAG: LysR family transcriptional regulator [Paracoccus sp.]|nr:LysR family transcriptional regulator [Paracoccus sp. (in: a-proteobacteria)]
MTADSLTLLRRLTSRARLRHLQALMVLNDLRSMSRAAETLGMTQPGMSQLVAELEQLLETTLFLRHSRGVTPTSAAADLLPVARRIMAATEDGAEVIASYNRRDGGLVRMGVSIAADAGLLPMALPRFAQEFPDIQLQIEHLTGHALDASFTSADYDIIACRWRPMVSQGWTFVPCLKDSLEVVCAPTHPLAKRDRVTDADLENASWLANHVATVARQHFDAYCRERGWQPKREVQIISRSPGILLSLISKGGLLSVLPRSIVQPAVEHGMLVTLRTGLSRPLPDVGYYWQEELSGSATRALTGTLNRASLAVRA